MSQRAEPELYCFHSPVLLTLKSKCKCNLAEQVDNYKSHFGCSVYGVLSQAIGDSTNFNTEY